MKNAMIVRLIVPFVYSLLLGIVWSAYMNKRFYSSLAPAFMLHVLLVLISGLVFKRLSFGVYGGIILAIVIGVMLIIRNRKNITLEKIYQYCIKLMDDGVFVFLVFYVFCFISNYDKTFQSWDEFSHWGVFLKECLRIDSLYCMSPLTFPHKDYVPAITLFETIWCTFSGRYAESDVYRAIQIFMFSLLMPVFECVSEYVGEQIKGRKEKNLIFRWKLFELGAVVLVLLVPLLFSTKYAFYFYHSIYCDMAVGIVFFWCLFEAYKKLDNFEYQIFSIMIGSTILVLSKMTAMALLPLVFVMLFVNNIFFSKEKVRAKHYVLMLSTIVVPVLIWIWFNLFVNRYVENTGDIQSYDGIKLSSLKDVFFDTQNSAISYLSEVKKLYVDAIIHRDILLHGSYVVAVSFIVISFWILARFANASLDKRKMVFAGIWTLMASIYYGVLMYFLYCTAFSEYEALVLASYERYMNSFVIALLFLLLASYFDSGIWKYHIRGYYFILAFLVMDLTFLHVNAFDQVLPGSIMHDKEIVSIYTNTAEVIKKSTSENSSIYVVIGEDNGDFLWFQRYYCNPRIIDGGNIKSMLDGKSQSSDLSVDDFVNTVGNYDYIYFYDLDNAFISKYTVAFEDPNQIIKGKIYKVMDGASKIKLE